MYKITGYRYSFWMIDAHGRCILSGDKPIRCDDIYGIDITIYPERTALVVMDPFADTPDPDMNKQIASVVHQSILPLAESAARAGHPVYIFTNDPATVDYSTQIDYRFHQLANANLADILYHTDNDGFISALKGSGMEGVIYTGFHSNGCILSRPSGMIAAHNAGLATYLVPEASAAVERPETEQTGEVHKTVCEMVVSFGFAYLLRYNDLMRVMNG